MTELTLHVGLGTFQPVREEVVEEHKLHKEWFEISADAAARIQAARDAGRRIVAVGTTTVRTLEYAARNVDSFEMWEKSPAQAKPASAGHPADAGVCSATKP